MKKKKTTGELPSLRQRAEERLTPLQTSFEDMSPEDLRKLVLELQTHQVELEIQGEELRESQIQLEHSRVKYVDLYDFAPNGYLTLDKNGLIREANLTVAGLLGVERGRLVKKPFILFIKKEDRDIFHGYLRQVFESLTPRPCELHLETKKGGAFFAQLDGILTEDGEGNPECRISLTDISLLKQAKEALREANDALERRVRERTADLLAANEELQREILERKKMELQLIQSEKLSGIGTFVSGIAHELNNPLTVVQGFARQLLQKEYAGTERENKLNIIVQQSERMVDIVRGLLGFVRKHELHEAPVILHKTLDGAVGLQAHCLEMENIRVLKDYAPDLPPVHGDANQLQQVFLNIILNAYQAMKGVTRKGMLRIKTCMAEGMVAIDFENNGPPVHRENLRRLFDPFYSTKEVGSGTGLGLWVSHGIIKGHRGDLWAENMEDGGVRFRVTLPAFQEKERGEKGPAAPEDKTKTGVLRILIVEDDAFLQMWMNEVLSNGDFLVESANNGREALEILRRDERKFDVVLSDIKMPEMDGLELGGWLKEHLPYYGERLLLITGDIGEDVGTHCAHEGYPCLTKPFDEKQLLEAIRAVAEGR